MVFEIRINGAVVSTFHVHRVATHLVDGAELGDYTWECYRYRGDQEDEDRLSGTVSHWVHEEAEMLAMRVLEEYDAERVALNYRRSPAGKAEAAARGGH